MAGKEDMIARRGCIVVHRPLHPGQVGCIGRAQSRGGDPGRLDVAGDLADAIDRATEMMGANRGRVRNRIKPCRQQKNAERGSQKRS